jgi:hypothetical protein
MNSAAVQKVNPLRGIKHTIWTTKKNLDKLVQRHILLVFGMNFFNSIGTEITCPSIRRITPLTMENEIVHEVPVLKGSPDIQEG